MNERCIIFISASAVITIHDKIIQQLGGRAGIHKTQTQ